MSADRAMRIRSSFAAVEPRADELVELFYTKFFAVAPAVRPMFPADMTVQKRMLLALLALVVKNADQLDAIRRPIELLGARHIGYGTLPEHYPIVRDVLVAALAEIAGDLWTDQLNDDWTETVNTIAGMMLDGAAREQKQAA